MKWRTHNFAGFIFLLLVSLTSYTALHAQEISEELSDFSEVKVFNGVKVKIVPSDKNSISITGHSKEDVEYEIVENRLEIKLSLENIWSEDNTLVTVNTRSLKTIDANESSVVEVSGVLETSGLTFRAQEAAAIYANIDAVNLYSKVITGGIIQVRGQVEDLEVNVNTGGKFFGENLEAERSEVSTGTGGHSEVHTSERIKATARLGGVIHIYGNPATIDTKTTLGGKILEKN